MLYDAALFMADSFGFVPGMLTLLSPLWLPLIGLCALLRHLDRP